MKLKKSIYAVAALGLMASGFSSCSDSYLDETIYSSYGTNVTDVDAKLLGLHYRIGELLGYSNRQGFPGVWQDGTDVGAPGDTEGVEVPYYKYNQMTNEDGAAAHLWWAMYKIIGAANIIIADEAHGTDAQRAEARFFRAYAYEQLVTGWGDVVLLTEPVTSPRTDLVRSPKAEADKVIAEDLEFAIANLPEVGATAKEARINKDAARMLAATSYLRMGYQQNNAEFYKKAEAHAGDIISSGKYKLISERYGQHTADAGDYYSDMFRYGNQRRSQGNTESIWTFEMEYASNIPNGTIGAPQQRRNWVAAFHKLDGMQNADSIGGRGNGRLRLSNYVKYGVFKEQGDVRNSNHNIRRTMWYNREGWGGATFYLDKDGYRVPNDNPNDPNIVATVTVGVGSQVYCHAEDTLNVFYPHCTKWGGYDPTDDFGWALIKDFPMMRYAEAYLLRAEARVRQGKTTDAAADINVLRDRAFKEARKTNPEAGKVTAAQMDIDFILDERIRELVGEENRRFTLMRTGELANRVDMMTKKWPEKETTKKIEGFDAKKHILLPVPLNEIQLNKDAELTQNPGY